MHEGSIMASALDLAAAQTLQAGARRVHRLRLRVGELSGVVPEALEFAFEAMRADGPAAQAVLEIESVPACYRCDNCQSEFARDPTTSVCPTCGSPSPRLIRGRELELTSLEVS